MAVRPILRMGHPILRQPADPIIDPTAPEIVALIKDMKDSMAAAGGTGLAAPQIGAPLRLVIFEVAAGRSGGEAVPLTILINPFIEPLSAEFSMAFEACLSLPGMAGMVPRASHIRYGGLDEKGKAFEREATGFHARVVQHECDHLDGVLYPLRMPDLSLFGYAEELKTNFGAG
jgi:peptide deformylase